MNIKNLLLAIGTAAALSSCSTAYKAGQTPDDVYYSPARQQQEEEYVEVPRQQDRYGDRYSRNNSSNNYDSYDNYRDDRFLRMSMGSPLRLSAYNDYMMYNGFLGYNSWRYNSLPFAYNSPMNSFYYWNSFYNPYNTYDYYYPSYGFGGLWGGGFGGYLPGNVIGKPSSTMPISRPRAFVPGNYAATNSFGNSSRYLDRPAATSPASRGTYINSGSRYNNRNSNSGLGNAMRRIISGNTDDSYYSNSNSRTSNSSSSNRTNSNSYTPPARSYEAPTRTYTPSSSSGSSSGSGGGGGGVSRPTRGGN